MQRSPALGPQGVAGAQDVRAGVSFSVKTWAAGCAAGAQAPLAGHVVAPWVPGHRARAVYALVVPAGQGAGAPEPFMRGAGELLLLADFCKG
ncbi:hypothetical protein, partial [Desulfovibrio sp.]|uniref:hypothetical protein n=1 Tax=Desulfovibrio sp. TaxID=885 RepID=UPI0025BA8AC2